MIWFEGISKGNPVYRASHFDHTDLGQSGLRFRWVAKV